jgi:hypothetical protein
MSSTVTLRKGKFCLSEHTFLAIFVVLHFIFIFVYFLKFHLLNNGSIPSVSSIFLHLGFSVKARMTVNQPFRALAVALCVNPWLALDEEGAPDGSFGWICSTP